MANTISTNVPSTVANYFSDEFQALMQSGGVAPPTAYTPPPSQSLTDFKAANANKQFFLSPQGSSYRLDSVTQGEPTPESAVLVDMNVAYGISSAQFSLTDWMMARIGNEIRDRAELERFGPSLSTAPKISLSYDMNNLSSDDLLRLLKSLATASRDGVAESNAGARTAQLDQLGLTTDMLSQALEMQEAFAEQAGLTGLPTGSGNDFEDGVELALANLVANLTAELEAQTLAYNDEFRTSAATTNELAGGLATASFNALLKRLQVAADLIQLQGLAIASVGSGSELDVQMSGAGPVLLTAAASGRQAATAALRASLAEVLDDPALPTRLADALAQNADALDTSSLPLPDQTALYERVARATIGAMKSDDALLQGVARQSQDSTSAVIEQIAAEMQVQRQLDARLSDA
jgi:hypothetical protein